MVFLKPREFGERCGYPSQVVCGWCREGKINAVNTGSEKRATWHIPETELSKIEPRGKATKEEATDRNTLKDMVRELMKEVIREQNTPPIEVKQAPHSTHRVEIKFYLDNVIYEKLKHTAIDVNTTYAVLIEELIKEGLNK